MTRSARLFIRSAAAFVLCVAAAAVHAAEPARSQDRFLARLVGPWEFVGSVRGEAVRYAGAGQWVLDGAWLRLDMRYVARPSAYEAQVFIGYDAKAGDYVAHWLDRFGAAGARVVGTGRLKNDGLELRFPYSDGEFRDRITLARDNSSGTLLLEVKAPDGTWQTFAKYAMRRPR